MTSIAKLLSLVLILMVSCHAESQTDAQLTQRCLDTFDKINANDIDWFLAQMPLTPSKAQKKQATRVLQRAHDKLRNHPPKSIGVKQVSYKAPSKAKQEQFGATNEARVKLLIESEKRRSHTSCKFLKTDKGWFLSSLP
ncbi:hypothetical protein L2750_09495 [Shewanella submarina]|uniref:DUF4019 domain-containing protein n=1 Tax=Shewanella submarina TaxID=2016376 RepID=A0ABV7G6S4_9GAMM|nr:hypothetical protein [Shewanella submarina]MCL1037388.1 hypothetical protein [Shewanella submarina]